MSFSVSNLKMVNRKQEAKPETIQYIVYVVIVIQ